MLALAAHAGARRRYSLLDGEWLHLVRQLWQRPGRHPRLRWLARAAAHFRSCGSARIDAEGESDGYPTHGPINGRNLKLRLTGTRST